MEIKPTPVKRFYYNTDYIEFYYFFNYNNIN